MDKRVTAEEFAIAYCKRSGISPEELIEWGRVVCPCECDSDLCEGWAMVPRESAEENVKCGVPKLAGTNYAVIAWP